jgi:hypothetical protein
MIEFVRRFAKEIGVDESKLLGCNRQLPVIDADFVEVQVSGSGCERPVTELDPGQ